MSAIYGIVAFDGRPMAGEPMAQLQAGHAHWGKNAVAWNAEGATLGAIGTAPPVVDTERRIGVVARARLDNRDELLDALATSTTQAERLADDQLAAMAYLRWGEDCASRLFGDWSLAAWNAEARRLLLARDHLGSTGLYFHRAGDRLLFASDPAALFAAGVPRRLDEWQLARYLAIFPGELERTIWQDVQSLPPASSVVCTPGGQRQRQYWRPDDAQEVRCTSAADYAEGLLHRYRAAVRTRLRPAAAIGSTLSSGLDSSSLTALAARLLADQGQRLTAFTSVPLYPVPRSSTVILDEGPLAAETARWCGNVDHVIVDSAATTPLAGIEMTLAACGQPVHAACNLYWMASAYMATRDRGIDTLLIGQLGNLTVSWAGGHPRAFDSIARANWRTAWTTLAQGRAAGASVPHLLRSQLLGPLVGSLRRLRGRLARTSKWAARGALAPHFADRLDLDAAMRAAELADDHTRGGASRADRARGLILNASAAGPLQQALGAAFGLRLGDPTADVRLVEYCFGLPDDLHRGARGDRLLLRQSIEGLVPPVVQWNPRRGLQAADVASRLRAHADEMEATLQRLGTVETVREYLDVPRLRQCWLLVRAGKASVPGDRRVRSVLLRGILAALFLEREEVATRAARRS